MSGITRIAFERIRQQRKEGWTDEHDDGSIAMAAACYAAPRKIFVRKNSSGILGAIYYEDPWPWDQWDQSWDKRKKHNRIRQLEIAGALIAAEIDRLLANGES